MVDALGEQYWAQQHLPGAIYLVEADVEAKAAGLPVESAAPTRG